MSNHQPDCSGQGLAFALFAKVVRPLTALLLFIVLGKAEMLPPLERFGFCHPARVFALIPVV